MNNRKNSSRETNDRKNDSHTNDRKIDSHKTNNSYKTKNRKNQSHMDGWKEIRIETIQRMNNRFWLQVSCEIVHPFAKNKKCSDSNLHIQKYKLQHEPAWHLGHTECHEEVGY